MAAVRSKRHFAPERAAGQAPKRPQVSFSNGLGTRAARPTRPSRAIAAAGLRTLQPLTSLAGRNDGAEAATINCRAIV